MIKIIKMSGIKAKCISNREVFSDKEIKELKVGSYYDVDDVHIGLVYSYVKLADKVGRYNSVLFEFYKNDEFYDIYSDKQWSAYSSF